MVLAPRTVPRRRRARGPLATAADTDGIEDLDVTGTADRLRAVTGQIHALEAERLALVAHWSDLHGPTEDQDLGPTGTKDVVTGERFLPTRSPDTPLVSEFAAPTLGALIGVGVYAADSLVDDSLDLRHRHPRLHELVMAGRVPAWQARRVVSVVADAEVSREDALAIDEDTALDFARLPFPRAMNALEGALLRAPSSNRARKQREAQEKQYARAGRSNDAGMKIFLAQNTAAGIIRFEAMVTHLADVMLEMGDTRPVDERRASAFLLLADPARACLVLAGHAPLDEVAPGLLGAPRPEPLEQPEPQRVEEPEEKARPDLAEPTESTDAPELSESPATYQPSDGSRLDDTEPESDDPGEPGAYGSWDFRDDRAWPFTFGRQLDLFPPDCGSGNGSAESDTALVLATAKAVGDALRDLGAGLDSRLWDRLRPRAVIYLHGWQRPSDPEDPDAPPLEPVLRGERVDQPLLEDTVRRWLSNEHVEVKPVIDATAYLSADAYEVPAAIREAVRLRHPFEEFPHGRQSSLSGDLDHLEPFRPDGTPGQTNTANLEPLGRRHHRLKTHSGWTVEPVMNPHDANDRVGALWRAPTGHWFLVDHLGTHDLGRPVQGAFAELAEFIREHRDRLVA